MTGHPHPLAPPPDEQHWVDTAAGLAAKFATTAAAFDESAEVPLGNLEALHASGLDAALLPGEFGGQDLSFRSYGEIVGNYFFYPYSKTDLNQLVDCEARQRVDLRSWPDGDWLADTRGPGLLRHESVHTVRANGLPV
jgi:hypothetical protein